MLLMNTFSVMVVATLLSSVIFVDGVEARGKKPRNATVSDFLSYCAIKGKSATDPNTGKHYCCLLGNETYELGSGQKVQCIECDSGPSGFSNCEAIRRTRRNHRPSNRNSTGTMAPKKAPKKGSAKGSTGTMAPKKAPKKGSAKGTRRDHRQRNRNSNRSTAPR